GVGVLRLRLEGERAASLYGLRYRDTFFYYQTGLDPAFARYGAGVVLMGLTIKHAIEEGVRKYDLLHGSERYKFHWARQVRQLERIDLYPPRLRGTAYRTVMDAGGALRKVARRLVPSTIADRVASAGAEHTNDVRHRRDR